jgi:sugar phosphate isomerase/epimerase
VLLRTRRDFLRGFGAAALGGIAGAGRVRPAAGQPAQSADPPPGEERSHMKLGLVTYLMGAEMGLPDLIAVCERTGFDGVELRTTHAHGVEPGLTADERRAVRERFAASTVKLACLGSTCEYDALDPADVSRNIDETRVFIELAHDTGAEAVKVRPNRLHEDQGVAAADTLKQIGEALRECAPFAEQAGVELWVEIHGQGTSHVPHCATIMEVCDHPSVGLTWNCNGGDIIDGSVRENYMLVRQWIRCLHIHDLYDRGYPYRELFRLLCDDGWAGWASQEMDGSSDPERVLHYYRALFDYMVAEARGEYPA